MEEELKNPESGAKKQEHREERKVDVSFQGARGNGEGAERERMMDGDTRIRITGEESDEENT